MEMKHQILITPKKDFDPEKDLNPDKDSDPFSDLLIFVPRVKCDLHNLEL